MDWESAAGLRAGRSISIVIDDVSLDYVSLITRRLLRIALSKNAALPVNDESIVPLAIPGSSFPENPIGIVKESSDSSIDQDPTRNLSNIVVDCFRRLARFLLTSKRRIIFKIIIYY